MASLKFELNILRLRFYDEYARIRLFRDDCAEVKDKRLEDLMPYLKRLSILKGKLTRKRGHSVMFQLSENGRKELISPTTYRFLKKMSRFHTNVILSYPRLINEMSIIYLVAIFEAYVIDIIRLVLIHNKALLKSSRHVSYDETFGFGDIEDLRTSLIEDEIASLSHKSFRDWCKFMSDKFNISFDLNLKNLNDVVEIIETRHLIIHNRGLVNEFYKRNFPDSTLKIGEQRVVDDDYVTKAFDAISQFDYYLKDSVLLKHCPSKLKSRN